MRVQIGVTGASAFQGGQEALAEELGREIAKSGAVLFAGTAEGAPGLAAKGAKEAGGLAIAIVFKKFSDDELSNFGATIFTGMSRGFDVFVKASDGIIAIGGGSGTLREVALAYKEGKPVVILEGAGGWADRLANTALDPNGVQIPGAKTPKEAVALLLELIRRIPRKQ